MTWFPLIHILWNTWSNKLGQTHIYWYCAAHIEKTATPFVEDQETPLPGIAQARRLKSWVAQWLSSFLCVFFVFCVFQIIRKVDEATNFAFVQRPSLYEATHSGFGVRRNFSLHEGNLCFLIKTYNKITTESSLIKATKIIHYHRCCFQGIMWVFIPHNYQLHLTAIIPLKLSCSCRLQDSIIQASSHEINSNNHRHPVIPKGRRPNDLVSLNTYFMEYMKQQTRANTQTQTGNCG